ncbi:MAG: GTPase Obg [Deltaproteobacteria bacterium]|nr:GTPase Obg [Deltaproteobacteria bacterium]
MRFIDQVRIVVRAGHGGDGAIAWRREKYVPKGGPAGGDGGRGGSVVLQADPHLSTLLDLHYRRVLRAPDGQSGGVRDRNGRGGEDLVVKVPVGTAVYIEGLADASLVPVASSTGDDDEGGMETVYLAEDPAALERLAQARAELEAEEVGEPLARPPADVDHHEAGIVVAPSEPSEPRQWAPGELKPAAAAVDVQPGELLGDLTEAGQLLVVAQGGEGGRGNIHFRSSTNRTPEQAEDGGVGDAWQIRLELKLLADVGIVGFPNVGKSTLIRRISRARPKVGAYPFTTLVPNLGVVQMSGGRSMVVADVPGLIRGASDGKGLGHQFLRHLERTRVLLHVLAPDYEPGREPVADLDALEQELDHYGSQFDGRPRVVALNKNDLLADADGRALVAQTRAMLRARNIPLFVISAETGAGVPKLLEALWRRLAPAD